MKIEVNGMMAATAQSTIHYVYSNEEFKQMLLDFLGDEEERVEDFVGTELDLAKGVVLLDKDFLIKLIVVLEWILDQPIISEALEKYSEGKYFHYANMTRNAIHDFKIYVR